VRLFLLGHQWEKQLGVSDERSQASRKSTYVCIEHFPDGERTLIVSEPAPSGHD
jgi:hypothetical protein